MQYFFNSFRIICELTVIFPFESRSQRTTVLPDLVFSKLRKSLELEYLSEFLVTYVSRRDLRSADRLLFCQPTYHTKADGSRAFSIDAPCMQNKLPMDIKCSPCIAIFKQKLKTHLFKLAYYSYFFYFYIGFYIDIIIIQLAFIAVISIFIFRCFIFR